MSKGLQGFANWVKQKVPGATNLRSNSGKDAADRGNDAEIRFGQQLATKSKAQFVSKKKPVGKNKQLDDITSTGARWTLDYLNKRYGVQHVTKVDHVNDKAVDLVVTHKGSRPTKNPKQAHKEVEIQYKILQRQKDGRIRTPTVNNSTSTVFSSALSNPKLSRIVARIEGNHVKDVANIMGVNEPDHQVLAGYDKDRRNEIADHVRSHLSKLTSNELHDVIHKHLNGGSLIPIPHVRYMAILPHHEQEDVLHTLSEPKKALKTVLNHFGGSLHVDYHGRNSSKVHIHGIDPETGKKTKLVTFDFTNGGRPTQVTRVNTTTNIPSLAARINRAKRPPLNHNQQQIP